MYRSPYEAYPYLSSKPEDLRCDFELMTDELASMTGLLRGYVQQLDVPEQPALTEELAKICELIYHVNPTTRTKLTVTEEEIAWLLERVNAMNELTYEENRPLFYRWHNLFLLCTHFKSQSQRYCSFTLSHGLWW